MVVTPPWQPGYGPVADSLAVADSIAAADSAAWADSMRGNEMSGLILEDPVIVEVAPSVVTDGMSWIYGGLALLFCIVALYVRNSGRYFKALFSDLTDTRERHNVFDDTVKETSFLILLNILWAASAGVLLWQTLTLLPQLPEYSFSIPDRPAPGIAICAGVSLAYVTAMMLAYWVIGNVFTDRRRTAMWLRGAGAANGIQAFVLFPTALLALTQPQWTSILLIIAAAAFLLGKIVFIFKGFRIFFNQISSWLLFLYYLCSLEIIPLILTYGLTLEICSRLL